MKLITPVFSMFSSFAILKKQILPFPGARISPKRVIKVVEIAYFFSMRIVVELEILRSCSVLRF